MNDRRGNIFACIASQKRHALFMYCASRYLRTCLVSQGFIQRLAELYRQEREGIIEVACSFMWRACPRANSSLLSCCSQTKRKRHSASKLVRARCVVSVSHNAYISKPTLEFGHGLKFADHLRQQALTFDSDTQSMLLLQGKRWWRSGSSMAASEQLDNSVAQLESPRHTRPWSKG